MRDAIAANASLRITQQQLVAWVEWAFTQKHTVREDSGVSALHEIIESRQVLEVRGQPRAMSQAMEERRRESLAMMAVSAPPMSEPYTSRRWMWIVLVLLLLVVAAAAGLLAARNFGVL
jgi:hypothetical protein